MNDVVAKLKALRHEAAEPSSAWIERNRSVLLSQIKNTVPATAPRFVLENVWTWLSAYLPRQMVYTIVRPVAVLVVVALVGTSGAIAAVDASYEALPGDFLYGAARAAQKTQVAVVSLIAGKNAEAKVRVHIAQQLAVKTQKIVKINDASKNERLAIAVADLKSEISTIANNFDQSKASQTATIQSDVAKDVKSNTDQIKSVLQEVKSDLLTSSSTVNTALTKEVNAVTDSTKDLSVKAVEALVANHVNGDTTASADDVKQALVSAAQATASDAVVSKQNVDGVKTLVDNVKSEVKDLAISSKTSTSTPVSPALVEQLNTVSNQTVASVIKSDVVTHDVTQKASEAEKLAQSGDFQKAVDKIKEASEASKVGDKISDAAIVKAQAVAPVVQVIKDGSVQTVVSVSNIGSIVPGFAVSASDTAAVATSTVKFATSSVSKFSTSSVPIKPINK